MGDVRNNVNRCYTGWLMVMGVKTTYTGLEEHETLIDVEQYFFVNPQNLEADYFLGFWDC